MLALAFAAAVLADSVAVRTGLATLLGASGDIRVTHTLDGAHAPSLGGDEVDVVVHDVPTGVTAEEALTRTPPHVPVLALVDAPERARELVRAGAAGVLHRDASGERLAAASVAVASGLAVFDHDALGALLAPTGAEVSTLSAREREVLELVADGLSNKLIAERLGVSEHTAKFHVRSLLDKLGADTRADAVARAARRGLLSL
jgi:two-component system, NarL family, nitrate/nitrite response regulator NarL